MATDTAAPFTFTLTNVAAGGYTFTAKATDNLGATTTSAAVSVTVNTGVAQLYFIHTDHLDTPRLITNGAGQAVWRWDQTDPFGGNVPDENPSGLGTFTCNLRLLGQYFDKETNLHYNYFRDYDPGIGRYIQADPLGVNGGVNLYAYVNQNPIKYSDPYGLRTLPGAVIGGVCIAIQGVRSVMDVLDFAEAVRIRNQYEEKIMALENSCPPNASEQQKFQTKQEIDKLRREGAGAIAKAAAAGQSLGWNLAIAAAVCLPIALLF